MKSVANIIVDRSCDAPGKSPVGLFQHLLMLNHVHDNMLNAKRSCVDGHHRLIQSQTIHSIFCPQHYHMTYGHILGVFNVSLHGHTHLI